MNLVKIFGDIVIKHPNNIAIIYKEKKITYKYLNNLTNNLSNIILNKYKNHFNKMIPKENIITICISRSYKFIYSIFSILKINCAYCAINKDYPDDRIKYMINDTSSDIIIVDNSTEKKIEEITNKKIYINIDKLNITNDDIYENINFYIKPENLAYIMYTSGTTGKPKGVMVEHKSIHNQILFMTKNHTLKKNDIHLHVLNFVFDASTRQIFWPLCCGATIFLVDEYFLYEKNNIQNIYSAYFTPSLYNIFINIYTSFKCKKIYFGGEKLSSNIVQSLLDNNKDIEIYNQYGPSETAANVTQQKITSSTNISIGKPIDNCYYYILSDKLQKVNKGETGELYIGGVQLARGYLNKPEITSNKFILDPFVKNKLIYKTGDLVKLNEDDCIVYIDRVDNQVKINGIRIELDEISKHIENIEGIKQCHTIKMKNKLILFYTKNNTMLDYQDEEMYIYNKIKSFLPKYMIPDKFINIENFKLNSSSKVDKNYLLEIYNKELKKSKNYTIDIELLNNKNLCIVIQCLVEITGLNKLFFFKNYKDDLKYIGIDSIKLIQLQSSLNKKKLFITPEKLIKMNNIYEISQNISFDTNLSNTFHGETYNKFRKLYIKNNKINGEDILLKITDIEIGNENIDYENILLKQNFDNNKLIDTLVYNIKDNLKNNNILKYDINNKNLEISKYTYNILYRGSCGMNQIIEYYIPFFKLDILNIIQDYPERGFQQSSLRYLFQNHTKENILEIKKDTNNIVNEVSFTIDHDNKDIIIIHVEDTLKRPEILHKSTNLLITGDTNIIKICTNLIENSSKSKFFELLKKMPLETFDDIINKFLKRYSDKIIIFVNRLELDDASMIRMKNYIEDRYNDLVRFKEANKILKKYAENTPNMYLLDVTKYIKTDKDIVNKHPGHFKPHIIFNISRELNDIICNIYKKNLNKNIFASSVLTNIRTINSIDNFKLMFIDENYKYLSLLIVFNNTFNKKIGSSGIIFDFGFDYLKKYFLDMNVKDFISIDNYRKQLPIKKYKITFFARTNKANSNFKFKIYTGIKYTIIEKSVTDKYQLFELEDTFNFTKRSPIRIGFINPNSDLIVYINSPIIL